MAAWGEVVDFLRAFTPAGAADAMTIMATPMREAFVICLDDEGGRATTPMRWGFSGRNDKTPNRPRHMHARAETIDQLPTFAEAFARRRGIVLVKTFNVGEELANGRTKQWTITPNDGAPLAIAVVWEEWRNEAQSLKTFVMASVPASPLIAPVTERMPALLRREDWPAWLGETEAPLADVKALLKPYEDEGGWTFAPEARGAANQPALF